RFGNDRRIHVARWLLLGGHIRRGSRRIDRGLLIGQVDDARGCFPGGSGGHEVSPSLLVRNAGGPPLWTSRERVDMLPVAASSKRVPSTGAGARIEPRSPLIQAPSAP